MLNDAQIQKIDSFFDDGGLEFFDLRIELTDHISQAIEEKINNGNISFDQAFDEEKAKFSSKDLSMRNFEAAVQYNPKAEWRWFTWRRMVCLLAAFAILMSPLLFLTPAQLYCLNISYLIAGCVVYSGLIVYFFSSYKKPLKKLSIYRRESPFSYFWFPFLLYSQFSMLLDKDSTAQMNKPVVLLSLVVFTSVVMAVMLLMKIFMQQKSYEAARKLYPYLFQD